MKKVYLGKTEANEELSLDFFKENIRCILLAGATGSGKSVFHTHLYRGLIGTHTPAELGFIVMDMTHSEDFGGLSDYLIQPVINDPHQALTVLEKIHDEKRTLLVHIEECDMVYLNRARFEKALDHILHGNKNIILVYSTSRIDTEYLTDWLKKYFDLKIIFRTASEMDSIFLIGKIDAYFFKNPGERIVDYRNINEKLIPLSKSN